jgi:drug/metabolite transporter (DMT)-like permease
MLEPVLAALIAWVWLEEELGALQIVGGLVVLAGVVLAQTARTENGQKAPETATMSRGVVRESA